MVWIGSVLQSCATRLAVELGDLTSVVDATRTPEDLVAVGAEDAVGRGHRVTPSP